MKAGGTWLPYNRKERPRCKPEANWGCRNSRSVPEGGWNTFLGYRYNDFRFRVIVLPAAS